MMIEMSLSEKDFSLIMITTMFTDSIHHLFTEEEVLLTKVKVLLSADSNRNKLKKAKTTTF